MITFSQAYWLTGPTATANGGHWLMEEAPEATIAAVQNFLAPQ